MSDLLGGFVSVQIDQEGNAGVLRLTRCSQDAQLYSIDSERVVDLLVVQGTRTLPWTAEVIAGKTIVSYQPAAAGWVGLAYLRESFVSARGGVFAYRDSWNFHSATLYFVALPARSRLRSVRPAVWGESQFLLDERIVTTLYSHSGVARIAASYTLKTTAAAHLPELTRSILPHHTGPLFWSQAAGAASTGVGLASATAGLDWLQRGLALRELLKICGIAG